MAQTASAPSNIVNVPLPARTGDAGYWRVFDELLDPIAKFFHPDLVLVSAGYDCHWLDPIGMMNLTLDGFAGITRRLQQLSRALCGGRLVFALEGGYALDALAAGVVATFEALLGDAVVDTIGPRPHGHEPNIDALLHRLKSSRGLR